MFRRDTVRFTVCSLGQYRRDRLDVNPIWVAVASIGLYGLFGYNPAEGTQARCLDVEGLLGSGYGRSESCWSWAERSTSE